MKSKIEQYKAELAELMETKNDPDTPKDIKDAIEPAIKKLNLLITGLGVKNLQSKVSKAPATSKKESKAPSTAKKSSDASLERCKEILAKYNDKKKTDAKRVEKRKKAGKPVELTPSETIKKAAKSVKTKVVEMDKGLKVSEEASIIRGILDSVVSAMSGIKDSHRKKMFIGKIIEGLRKLEKGVRLKTAEDGMYLHEINGDLEDDNAEMLRLNIVEIRHHADEIMQSLNGGSDVEAWVLSRSERAKTDMSDIAHYLDSSLKVDSMADGGMMAKGSIIDSEGGYKSLKQLNEDYKRIIQAPRVKNFYEESSDSLLGKTVEIKLPNEDKSFKTKVTQEYAKMIKGSGKYSKLYDKENIISIKKDGGMMTEGGEIYYDLFEAQDKIPQKVQDVLNDYVEYGEDITYEQLMSMQNDMERVGYTFDFGLDAIPYGLRPLGVDIDELQEYEENEYSDAGYYAHGGMMTHYWVIADDKRGELYVFNDGYYNTKEEAEDALNKIKIPKIVDANTVRVEAVPTNPNYIALFNNLSMMNGGMMADGGMMAKGGSIGFIPMDLEEDLMLTARWGGTNIKGVIGILNAMIDSNITDEDLKPIPTKSGSAYEKARAKKTEEIWAKIVPKYKGEFKGNMYYSTIMRLVERSGSSDQILKRYKPFRKFQKDNFASSGEMADGGIMPQGKLLEKVSEDWGRDSDFYSELEEAIIGWSDRHGQLTPKGKIAIKNILINYDSLEDYEQYLKDGGMTAGRGRLLSALNRDRAYMSSQEWEKNYKRKGSPKKPKYNTSYAVGGQAKVKQYPDLSKIKANLIN